MVIKYCGKDNGILHVQLGKHLILTPPNMTKLIDKLEKGVLVECFALKGDIRVNITKITKRGTDLLGCVWEGYNAKLSKLTAQLNKGDQKTLSRILVSWLQNMKGDPAQ